MDMLPLSSQSSSHPSHQPSVLQLHGLDLFFGEFKRARIFLNQVEFVPRIESGIPALSLLARGLEVSFIWDLIQNPPADLSVVLDRQEIIRELEKRSDLSTAFLHTINAGYALFEGVSLLGSSPEFERDSAQREKREAKNWFQLLVDRGVTEENLQSKAAEFSAAARQGDDVPRQWVEALEAFTKLDDYRVRFQGIYKTLAQIKIDAFTAIQSQLQSSEELVPPLKVSSLLKYGQAHDRKAVHELQTVASEFNTRLSQFGALFGMARTIQRDQLTFVTFNAHEPEGYKAGWNFLRQKTPSRYEMERFPPQTTNHSPEPVNQVVLCGSNMSGKSYYLKQDLLIHLVGQAFGYAPAREANLHIADSFVWVDRNFDSGKKGLSAFGREITVRSAALKSLGNRTLYYSDEGFSTTASKYSGPLHHAFDRYLLSRGARVMVAAHDDAYLSGVEKSADAKLYHFKVSIEADGKASFSYKLKPGRDSSHAVEVAAKLGLPSKFIGDVQNYLAGQRVVMKHQVKTLRELPRYTEEERSKLKQTVGTFRKFLPCDEIEIFKSSLKWRYGAENSWSGTGPEPARYADTRIQSVDDRIFSVFSAESGFRHFHIPVKPEWSVSSSTMGFMNALSFYGATDDSRELQERQQLWRSLADSHSRRALFDLCSTVLETPWKARVAADAASHDFNKTLLHVLKLDFDERFGMWFRTDRILPPRIMQITQGILQLNAELSGVDLASTGILDDLYQLQKISSCMANYTEAHDALYRQKSDLNDSAEFQAASYALYKQVSAELTQLTGFNDIQEESLHTQAQAGCQAVVTRIFERSESLFTGHSIFGVQDPKVIESLRKLAELVRAERNDSRATIHTALVGYVFAYDYLTDPTDSSEQLITQLREHDSVHLHQLANYFEPILKVAYRDHRSGIELSTKLKAALAVRKDVDYRDLRDLVISEGNACVLRNELEQLQALFVIAEWLHSSDLTEVKLSGEGQFIIKNGWNLGSKKGEQIANSIAMIPPHSLTFATGPNMSGKSFNQQGVTLAALCAQVYGWGPGSEVVTPLFSKIVHLDRVPAREDLALSSFGTEVHYWKKLLTPTQPGERRYIACDEPFSTTSSKYQDAFIDAVSRFIVEDGGITALIATHAPHVVNAICELNPEAADAYHFATHYDEEGVIQFDYRKRQGVGDSNAIDVAEKLGLDGEIVKMARVLL